MYKKIKKRVPTRNNFVVALVSKFRYINPYDTGGMTGGDICTSLVTCYLRCKEEPGVSGSIKYRNHDRE